MIKSGFLKRETKSIGWMQYIGHDKQIRKRKAISGAVGRKMIGQLIT